MSCHRFEVGFQSSLFVGCCVEFLLLLYEVLPLFIGPALVFPRFPIFKGQRASRSDDLRLWISSVILRYCAALVGYLLTSQFADSFLSPNLSQDGVANWEEFQRSIQILEMELVA